MSQSVHSYVCGCHGLPSVSGKKMCSIGHLLFFFCQASLLNSESKDYRKWGNEPRLLFMVGHPWATRVLLICYFSILWAPPINSIYLHQNSGSNRSLSVRNPLGKTPNFWLKLQWKKKEKNEWTSSSTCFHVIKGTDEKHQSVRYTVPPPQKRIYFVGVAKFPLNTQSGCIHMAVFIQACFRETWEWWQW